MWMRVGFYVHRFVGKVVGRVVYEGLREDDPRDGVEEGMGRVPGQYRRWVK